MPEEDFHLSGQSRSQAHSSLRRQGPIQLPRNAGIETVAAEYLRIDGVAQPDYARKMPFALEVELQFIQLRAYAHRRGVQKDWKRRVQGSY